MLRTSISVPGTKPSSSSRRRNAREPPTSTMMAGVLVSNSLNSEMPVSSAGEYPAHSAWQDAEQETGSSQAWSLWRRAVLGLNTLIMRCFGCAGF